MYTYLQYKHIYIYMYMQADRQPAGQQRSQLAGQPAITLFGHPIQQYIILKHRRHCNY